MTSHLLKQLKEGSLSKSGVLEHLSQLIRQSVQNKSDLKGLSNIEIFSYYLRKNKFVFEELLTDKKLAKEINTEKQYQDYVNAVKMLDWKLNGMDDHRPYLRPDLMQEHQALKTAGIGIPQTNAYHLNKIIKGLAVQYQTKQIRFWGKILGYQDYYVIQGSSNKTYLSELPNNAEKYGNGVNTYSYWVATDLLGKWIQLPLVTPQQVVASRTFKYIFTGNLELPINKNPSFQGKEKHLLKCIVARITHSCQLAPKGLYKLSQENPNILQFEEQFKIPQIADMNSLDNWIHLNPHIQLQGRCSHFIDPSLAEEQKEAVTAELAEKDPIVQRLKGISEDKPYQNMGFTTNWTVNISGQTVPVSQIGKLQGQNLIYGVAVLKNMVWPGAVTVGYRGGWVNFYCGYGHRLSQPFNAIRELKQIQVEAEQVQQRPQPNPSNPPPPVEQKKQQAPGEPSD